MNDINKIIRVLDLSKSDAREGTLDGIIKYIIFSSGDSGIEEKKLSGEILKELTIDVHEQDIIDSLVRLKDEELLKTTDKGNLKLILDEEIRFRQLSLEINESRNARFKLFKTHIEKIALEFEYPIIEGEIDDLWEIFRTFIYECYLTHGKNAISNFTNEVNEHDESLKKLVNKYKKDTANKTLSKILSKYIQIYPKVIDSNILKYLTDLANKTESFYSLGLSQEEYNKLYEDLKFDWIIFVDTNFIYSILNLHNHPENQAAKFLLELGTELGISFKYTTKTYNELNQKKTDFEKYLEKDLQPTQIKALLKSGKLDNFAQSYYEKLIKDKDNTPHPSDIIVHSQNSMKEKSLVIYNSKFERLKNSEEFLLDQESEYNSYLALLDEVRQEKGLKRKGQKDSLQVEHDIFLREAILSLRKANVTSMTTAKYFGVTLDKTLIKFDSHQLRKKVVGVIIPTFFKPSILLKKLLRQAPLKTKENYLRAFVSTISTPAIDDNYHISKIAIRSLKYFHNIGIDNEKLILGCLKDELFLRGFDEKEKNQTELDEFVESALNKQITEQTAKMEKLEVEIKKKSRRLNTASELSDLTSKENKKLTEQANELKNRLDIYHNELKKLKKKGDKINTNISTIQYNIYDEQEKIKAENRLKESDNRNKYLKEKIITSKLNKRKIMGVVYGLISLMLLIPVLLIFIKKQSDWNFMTELINSINLLDDFRKNTTYIFLALLLTFIEFMFVKKFIYTFNSESINEYRKKLEQKL